MIYLVVAIANLLVGGLIGIAGIAGFLLPILFTGFLGLPLADALALSFLSFLTSGALGAASYHKSGNLDTKLALPLCVGSIVGALVGVQLNLVIPTGAAKVLLYVVVLLSGLCVMLKKQGEDGAANASPLLSKNWFLVVMGVVTAAICSLTGAGGPILVVPLLAALGVNMRVAVGVSLLNSIAIALPAFIGYLGAAGMPGFWALCAVSVATHAVGVLVGAKVANRVNLKVLRLLVGLLAIGAAGYMLLNLLLQ